jgi:hypothetical protein
MYLAPNQPRRERKYFSLGLYSHSYFTDYLDPGNNSEETIDDINKSYIDWSFYPLYGEYGPVQRLERNQWSLLQNPSFTGSYPQALQIKSAYLGSLAYRDQIVFTPPTPYSDVSVSTDFKLFKWGDLVCCRIEFDLVTYELGNPSNVISTIHQTIELDADERESSLITVPVPGVNEATDVWGSMVYVPNL